MTTRLLLPGLLLLVSCRALPTETMPTETTHPDLIVTNARVWTASPAMPWAEAIAVRGERVQALGTAAEIEAQAGPATRMLDARGALVTPGLIDAHVHFLQGGFRLSSVQLRDAATPAELTARIAAFAATVPAGTWILGGDWDHENWGGELPQRAWIDGVTPAHPVWVHRLDGHMALANSRALSLAGVDASTAEIEGGEIVRLADGLPSGVLKDNAMDLVRAVVPPPAAALEDRALDAAMAYVAARGVTAVHHMGTWADLEVFQRAHRDGRLRTRLYAAVPLASWEQLRDHVAEHGRGDDWLATGMLKGFVDGSLGSHTAAMLAPFSDQPDSRGLFVHSEEELRQWIVGADEVGLQVTVHAIGDRAIRTLLDLFAEAQRANGARDRRFRMEHAQHIHPDDLPRFAQLDVIASMQPYHAIDDGRWAEKVIGAERAATTYAFGSLLENGARLGGWCESRARLSAGICGSWQGVAEALDVAPS